MVNDTSIQIPASDNIADVVKVIMSKMAAGSGKVSIGALEPIIKEAMEKELVGELITAQTINNANQFVSGIFRRLEAHGYLVWDSHNMAYVRGMNCFRDGQTSLALHPFH